MYKKILAVCAALMAFAVLPAMASASPALTEHGVAVATGVEITATNDENIVFNSSLGPVTCVKSTLHGKLTVNSGKLIEGDIEKATFTNATGGDCVSSWAGEVKVTPEGLPWCIKTTATADTFLIRGAACTAAETPLTFTLDFTSGGFSCKYSRTGGISGTFTTGGTQATLTANASEFIGAAGNGGLCPSKGTLNAKYTLETSNGTELEIS